MSEEVGGEHVQKIFTAGRVQDNVLGSIAAEYATRFEQFKRLADREITAYELFKKVALATTKDGRSVRSFSHPTRPGESLIVYCFPSIDYDPEPSDSGQRSRIELRSAQHVSLDGTGYVEPWLGVFSASQDNPAGDVPRYCTARRILGTIAGYTANDVQRRGGLLDLMLNSNPDRRDFLYNDQNSYIMWLRVAAECVEVSPDLQAPHTKDISWVNNLYTATPPWLGNVAAQS